MDFQISLDNDTFLYCCFVRVREKKKKKKEHTNIRLTNIYTLIVVRIVITILSFEKKREKKKRIMQYVFSHNSYHTFNPFANRGKQFFFYIIRKKKITRHKIEIRKNMFRRKERSAPFFIFCIKKNHDQRSVAYNYFSYSYYY